MNSTWRRYRRRSGTASCADRVRRRRRCRSRRVGASRCTEQDASVIHVHSTAHKARQTSMQSMSTQSEPRISPLHRDKQFCTGTRMPLCRVPKSGRVLKPHRKTSKTAARRHKRLYLVVARGSAVRGFSAARACNGRQSRRREAPPFSPSLWHGSAPEVCSH